MPTIPRKFTRFYWNSGSSNGVTLKNLEGHTFFIDNVDEYFKGLRYVTPFRSKMNSRIVLVSHEGDIYNFAYCGNKD